MGQSRIKHVAIIMDGNGRWANERSHQRIWGHVRGASVVSEIVEEANDLGISALTLYSFSTENWSRPLPEIKVLFKILKKFLLKERTRIISNEIRFKVIGNLSKLPKETLELIDDLENETKNNSGLKLTFAFGYGGRQEIVTACNSFFRKNPDKEITENDLGKFLLAPEAGDVDLLIRTGGDMRISNFLLWQSAYAELFFTPIRWPNFTRENFNQIICDVQKRERRFGSLSQDKTFNEIMNKSKDHLLMLEGEELR